MQIKLTIVFVIAAFALASFPAVAADMPADGTKNFSAPSDTPSYFTNEAVPESARVDHPVPFTSEDVAAAPEVGPAYPSESEPGRHGKHAYAHKYSKHASGRSKGHGDSAHYGKATSSRRHESRRQKRDAGRREQDEHHKTRQDGLAAARDGSPGSRGDANVGRLKTAGRNVLRAQSAAIVWRSPRCCRQRSIHNLLSFSWTLFCDRRRCNAGKSTRSISWS